MLFNTSWVSNDLCHSHFLMLITNFNFYQIFFNETTLKNIILKHLLNKGTSISSISTIIHIEYPTLSRFSLNSFCWMLNDFRPQVISRSQPHSALMKKFLFLFCTFVEDYDIITLIALHVSSHQFPFLRISVSSLFLFSVYLLQVNP